MWAWRRGEPGRLGFARLSHFSKKSGSAAKAPPLAHGLHATGQVIAARLARLLRYIRSLTTHALSFIVMAEAPTMAAPKDGSSYFKKIQGTVGGQPLEPPHNIAAWTTVRLHFDQSEPEAIPGAVMNLMKARASSPAEAPYKDMLQSRISPRVRDKICAHLKTNELSWEYMLRDTFFMMACELSTPPSVVCEVIDHIVESKMVRSFSRTRSYLSSLNHCAFFPVDQRCMLARSPVSQLLRQASVSSSTSDCPLALLNRFTALPPPIS